MTRAAIIPARGSSRRIPRKNIRAFCGKPVIAYSIEAALASGCCDHVMVSTDDEEIAAVARRYGADVPFLRSPATSTDDATTASVVLEVLDRYGESGIAPDYVCCIYATAPLIDESTLRQGLAALESDPRLSVVLPVVRFSYPIQRALRLLEGRVTMIQPANLTTRSQDLEPTYHDAGQFYWIRVAAFRSNPVLIGPGTAPLELSATRVQDIDNEEDWAVAEAKFRAAHGNA